MKPTAFFIRATAILLTLILLLSAFAGCAAPDPSDRQDAGEQDGDSDGKKDTDGDSDQDGNSAITTVPQGMTGTDVAKLLLAEQRLSGELIGNGDTLFGDGAEAYGELAAKTRASIAALGAKTPLASAPLASVGFLRSSQLSETHAQVDEFSRSYEYFKSIANQIVSQAESGADMIDYAKNNIRVVDKWVSTPYAPNDEFYLHVEANEETLYRRTPSEIKICHRYKNEKGQDVYELYEGSYEQNVPLDSYSVYISGERYELTYLLHNGRYDTLVAENTKGYWEVFTNTATRNYENPNEMLHAPQFFVLKQDLAYSFMHLMSDGSKQITLLNEARTSDILTENNNHYGESYFEIFLGAFDGITGVTNSGDGIGTVLLENGETLEGGQCYLNGALARGGDCDLTVSDVRVGVTAWGVEATVHIRVITDSVEESRAILMRQLAAWGLTVKYGDLDFVFSELDRAAGEADDIISYHKWNGYSTGDRDSMTQALEAQKALHAALLEPYESIRDAETYVFSDKRAPELAITLAPVTQKSATNLRFADSTVTLDALTLSLADTMLLVNDTQYAVFFALASEDSGALTHLDVAGISPTFFTGGKSFELSCAAVSFTLPVALRADSYTVVAYIGTEDGIRVSDVVALTFDTITDSTAQAGNLRATYSQTADRTLLVRVEAILDVYLDLSTTESVDYEGFRSLVESAVFAYGFPSEAAIEAQGEGESFVALSGSEAAIAEGVYRLSYTVENGKNVASGYVYLSYRISAAS